MGVGAGAGKALWKVGMFSPSQTRLMLLHPVGHRNQVGGQQCGWPPALGFSPETLLPAPAPVPPHLLTDSSILTTAYGVHLATPGSSHPRVLPLLLPTMPFFALSL